MNSTTAEERTSGVSSMAERKVVTRPWRIERLQVGGWRCLITVTTQERAEQELSWYRAHRYGPLRAKNRETGEVIGDTDA